MKWLVGYILLGICPEGGWGYDINNKLAEQQEDKELEAAEGGREEVIFDYM